MAKYSLSFLMIRSWNFGCQSNLILFILQDLLTEPLKWLIIDEMEFLSNDFIVVSFVGTRRRCGTFLLMAMVYNPRIMGSAKENRILNTESVRILDLSKRIEKKFINELKKVGCDSLFKDLPDEYIYGQERMGGSALAPVYAEIVNLKDENKIIDLGMAALFGRCFVIAQDQMIDGHRPITNEQIITTPILCNEFIHRTNSLVKNQEFNKKMNEILLINQRGNFIDFVNGDLGQIGDKIKVTEIPVIAACYMANKPELQDIMANIPYKFNIALQLVDDMSDTERDMVAKNMTAPVVKELIKNGKLSEEVFEELIIEPIILTSEIKNIINKINPKAYVALNYVEKLNNNLKNLRSKIKTIKDLEKLDCYLLQKDLLRK